MHRNRSHLALIRASTFVVVLLAGPARTTPAHASPCKPKGDRPQVFVKPKTPLRRGPGLNYGVSKFLEEGRCLAINEVSLDEAWVLVEDEVTKVIGWVPAAQVESESRDKIPSGKAKTGPIGSGQSRGYVSTKTSASLLSRPDPEGDVRKVLPAGSRLLALAMTEDSKWVEVRDDRGETGWVGTRGLKDESGTLEGLPKTSSGLETGITAGGGAVGKDPEKNGKSRDRDLAPPAGEVESKAESASKDRRSEERPRVTPEDRDPTFEPKPPMSTGLHVDAEILAIAALPRNGLDSNGAAGIRRYAVRALAAGAHFEATAAPVGPFRARLAYSFVLLTGLALKDSPDQSITGQQHDARLLFGYPIELGSIRLTPELGYALALFAIQPSLPGAAEPQFFSSHSHGLNAGLSASIDLFEDFSLDLEGAGLLGTTIAYPFDLGGAGLTVGALGEVGIRYALGGGAGFVAQWAIHYRRAPFDGASLFDPTITSALLTHVEQGVSVGISLAL